MFTYYCFNLNVYLIYFTTFIYLSMSIYTNDFIFCFIELLLFYMLYVYTSCEDDLAIENSLKTNYVTEFIIKLLQQKSQGVR